MTIAITPSGSKAAWNGKNRHGNYPFDCGGAQVRAHSHHVATVVTIRGEIDGINVDRVREYVGRFILGQTPVVLDMSEVTHFAAAGISVLCMLDEACCAAGVEWTLVASPAVIEQLGDGRDEDSAEPSFPVARSVHEALRALADAIVARRQLVLSLIKKTELDPIGWTGRGGS